ncbi:lipopolysaccharide assembly protein LapB [Photobacterium sp. 1_MG-2023]|uniref:tetratricopeptide repeat protein n=1 Tax=Photobacterium sp. 1_MG-2023 TaxID=3062646 RepID=UPI0026E44BA8|nr:hypothetical protein [Photobacterium sp. 1_MG-2023]MDO6706736.1 hypothetical protein [Photobacterium sp. 1_MG-2023]
MKKYALILALLFTPVALSAQLSQYSAGKVQQAQKLQQENKLNEAISVLKGMDISRAYDRAFIDRVLGVYYWQAEKPSESIRHLSQSVSSGLLEDEQARSTQRMLADILLSQAQYKTALKHYYQLSQSIPASEKADELWLRIAQAHYQIEEWRPVLSALQHYERLHRKDEVQPLTMKLGAQLQLKQLQSALPTLNRLIVLQPEKKVWWQQMAGIQMQLDRHRHAMETLALAQRQGVDLSQQDLKTLGQLYAQQGIPEKAARIFASLENSDSDETLLVSQATYWQMAKEWDKSISSWQKVVQLNSKYRWQLAQLLIQEGQYQLALNELNQIQDSKRKADVELAKVRVFYKLEQYEQAIVHAKKADQIESSKSSQSWIKYLNQIRNMNS